MIKPRKLLFVLADGARARFVERSTASGDFVTVEHLDYSTQLRKRRAELRASPPASGFESFSTRRYGVEREDSLRSAKEEFMAEVADRAALIAKRRRKEALFLISPPRLIGPLRSQVGDRMVVAGVLGKDLTKMPDHELGAWLIDALFSVRTVS